MVTGFDGKAVFRDIPRGYHRLSVRKKGYDDYEHWIWVGDSTQVTVDLIPRPSNWTKRIWDAIVIVTTLYTVFDILSKAAEALQRWFAHYYDIRARL